MATTATGRLTLADLCLSVVAIAAGLGAGMAITGRQGLAGLVAGGFLGLLWLGPALLIRPARIERGWSLGEWLWSATAAYALLCWATIKVGMLYRVPGLEMAFLGLLIPGLVFSPFLSLLCLVLLWLSLVGGRRAPSPVTDLAGLVVTFLFCALLLIELTGFM